MKVIVFLAEGFEEIEALTVVDYLRRMDILVDTVSITDEREVKGAHDIRVISDRTIAEIEDINSYDGVVIPGGMPGATNLKNDKRVVQIVSSFNEKNKLISAICAGPIVLDKADIIKDKNVTSYPGFDKRLKGCKYREEPVVRDENIITARGPALAVDFAIEIIEYLLGEKRAEDLKRDILYRQ
ncbi:DJ-1 family glyoxalase III [Tissierellaceae bacterium HCP3S3_D8]